MDIIQQLKRDEGLSIYIYEDTRGFHTIGVGHNLDTSPIPNLVTPITEAQATQILGQDVERISRHLVLSLPWVTTLDEVRLGVLQNMAFNIGVNGLLGFHHTLAYVQAGQYEDAAAAMKDSEWYTQVGIRAQRLCQQMETGCWV